jgi:hypothetical protein
MINEDAAHPLAGDLEPLFNLAKAKIAATHRREYPEPGGERSGATGLPGAVPLRYASIPIT